jgi:hypothetical protein
MYDFRELLIHGASVFRLSNYVSTTLNTAASKGHVGVVREFLKHGFRANNLIKNFSTAV